MYMYIYVCMYVCDPVQPFQTSVPLLCCACIDMIPSVSLSLLGEHHKLKFNITRICYAAQIGKPTGKAESDSTHRCLEKL